MDKIKKYKNGNSQMAYQGDISCFRVEPQKVNYKPLPLDGFIVAVGETTGNRHVVVAEPESLVEMAEDSNGVFIRILKGSARLTGHNEHSDIDTKTAPNIFTEGEWFVGRKDEYDELEERRRISD
jgi:hypothetical protein